MKQQTLLIQNPTIARPNLTPSLDKTSTSLKFHLIPTKFSFPPTPILVLFFFKGGRSEKLSQRIETFRCVEKVGRRRMRLRISCLCTDICNRVSKNACMYMWFHMVSWWNYSMKERAERKVLSRKKVSIPPPPGEDFQHMALSQKKTKGPNIIETELPPKKKDLQSPYIPSRNKSLIHAYTRTPHPIAIAAFTSISYQTLTNTKPKKTRNREHTHTHKN